MVVSTVCSSEGDTVLVEDSLESGWIVNNHSDDSNVVKTERRQGVDVDPSGCYRLGQGCETSRSVRYSNDEFRHLKTYAQNGGRDEGR